MKKLLIFLAVIGLFILLVKKYGPATSKSIPFTGTFVHVYENGVSGVKDTTQITVATDGKKFRLIESSQDLSIGSTSEVTMVYDGDLLKTKSLYTASSTFGASEPEPRTDQKQIKPKEAEKMMFWLTMERGAADAGPGGLVAGRNTLLYQMRENRSDATVTIQRWVDAESKILLKSSISIYAKQVDSLLSKDSYECLEFKPGLPDPSLFQAP